MAELSSPASFSPHQKRGQSSPHSRGSGTGRGRSQHGTPFKPNLSNSSQNNLSSKRGGPGKTSRGIYTRGQGRGKSATTNTSAPQLSPFTSQPASSTQSALKTKPSADEIRQADLARENLSTRREKVHARYVDLRKNAIEKKLMDDPNRRKTLQDSIRKVGTCLQMCDEKERVDRMFENLVDSAETEPNPDTHKPVPIEGKMVKRFRRAAAGDPDQQLEELRTPETLRKTMDYLIQDVISSDSRLPQVHKFVWDRTRAIRNDFTIQNFYNPEDVKHEIDCYERIARFHILSMHQMINPDRVRSDEHYDGQQDLEQLNKTILTLLTKYDDFRHVLDFPNEAEFRAYFILIEMRNAASDLEDRVQRWPRHIFNDGRVQTALKLYSAACSIDQRFGTLGTPIPVAMAQQNSGRFWTLLDSLQVSYLMACTVEMSFFNIRFTAMNTLWIAVKNASKSNQSTLRFWTKAALQHYLGYDYEDQAGDFCSELGLSFATRVDPKLGEEEEYLDFTSSDATSLDKNQLSMNQIFSGNIVERKRHGRTLFAVISGMSVAGAKRAGQVETVSLHTEYEADARQHSMFVDDDDDDDDEDEDQYDYEHESNGNIGQDNIAKHSILNPEATTFAPQNQPAVAKPSLIQTEQPRWMTHFGQSRSPKSDSPGELPKGVFTPVQDPEPEPRSLSPFAKPSAPISQKSETGNSTGSISRPSAPSGGNLQPPHVTNDFASFTNGFKLPMTSAYTTPQSSVLSSPFQTNVLAKPQGVVDSSESVAKPFFAFDNSASTTSQEVPKSQTANKQGSNFFAQSPQVTSSLSDTIQPPSLTAKTVISQSFSPFKFGVSQPSNNSTQLTSSPSVTRPHSSNTTTQNIQSAGAFTQFTKQDSQSSAVTTTTPVQPQPQPTTKRPSLESIQFPSVTSQRLNSELDNNSTFSFAGKASEIPRQASVSPSAQLNTLLGLQNQSVKPSSALLLQSQDNAEKKVDQEQLLHDLVRLGLVQTDGIIDMFVSRKISHLVRDVFDAFHQRRFDNKITVVRHKVLRRKYFVLWKKIVESRRLHKRAEKRRSRLAASMKADAEKEKRKEAEMQQIIEADMISRHIRAEQRRLRTEVNKQEKKGNVSPEAAESILSQLANPSDMIPSSTRGRKRKSPANSVVNNTSNDTSERRMHKRSRTRGMSMGAPWWERIDESELNRLTGRDGGMTPRRSINGKALPPSSEGPVDKTRTDYFRLIAYGIDPATPLNPMTHAQVEEQKKRKAEKDAATIARMTRGRLPKKSTEETVASIESPTAVSHTEEADSPSRASTPKFDPDTDPVIQAMREAKRVLAEDTEWCREQIALIKKEIEQHEEFRRSLSQSQVVTPQSQRLSQSQSSNSSFAVSANGMAISLNGYEYMPPNLKPGETLSRTEERIRRTGAFGLATAPIGGKPGYTPVAMSKRSALKYIQERNQSSQPSTTPRGSVNEGQQANGVGDHPPSVPSAEHITSSPQPAPKLPTVEIPKPRPTKLFGHTTSINPTSPPQSAERIKHHEEPTVEDERGEDNQSTHNEALYEGEEDEEYLEDDQVEYEDGDDEGEADNEEEENEAKQLYTSNRRPSQTSSIVYTSEDEEDEEEEEEEDEDAEQGDFNDNGLYAQSWGYGGLQAPTTFSRHGSAALSGVATPDTGAGASVDDAIELSD